MKRIIGISTFLLVIILTLGLTEPGISQSGTTVRVDPSSMTLDPGETATVNIRIDLAEGEELFAFDIELHFDPEHLSAANLAEGEFLNNFLPAPTNGIDNESGIINYGFSQGPDDESVLGSGTLFSFDIQAGNASGESLISIIEAELVESYDNPELLDYSVVNGVVFITGDIPDDNFIYLPVVLK